MINFGIVKPGSTLRIPFDSFAASTGASSALSNFAVGDILIYKDGNTTARASTTGYTATTSFSSVTGINEAVVDLSSDATGDFYKSGSNYVVVISPVTIDTQTVAFVAATFSIGYPDAILNTSIATLSSQTSFTLTAGPAEDDALNGLWCLIHDKASAVQITWAIVLDYTGSTKTVTLAAAPAATFTIAAIDNISFFQPMPMQPTVTGRTLDVSTGGEAGVDWANIGSPTTAQNLSGTSTKAVEPTVAGRTLDVSAGGEAGVDWANVGSPTTTVGLSGTTVKTATDIATQIAALNNLSAAAVNAEVLDVLNVDTFAQPGQAAPAATTTIRLMLAWLYKAWRNQTTQSATQYSLLNDDAVTVDQKATFADDGTTATRGEIATGP